MPTLSPEETAALLRAADGVRREALRELAGPQREHKIFAQVVTLHQSIDHDVRNAGNSGVAIACKVGCSHCCHARVEAPASEVFVVVRALRGKPAAERTAIIERLQAHAAVAHDAASWAQRPACPFLTDNLCSIYEQRPSACRKAHSLSLPACATGAAEIPQSVRILVTVEARTRGTADAFQALGLDAQRHEFVRAVLFALGDPTAEARWLKGERVFGH